MREGNSCLLKFDKAAKVFGNAVRIVDGLLFVPDLNFKLPEGMVVNDDTFMMGIVTIGQLEATVKGTVHTISSGDIVMLFPGDTIESCLQSEDARGAVFISSSTRSIELVKDNSLYLYTFRMRNDQVLKLPPHYFNNIEEYVSIIKRKVMVTGDITLQTSRTILHLVQAGISEFFEGIMAMGYQRDAEKVSQIEKLYKDFINLLSVTPIRPREVEWYANKLHITPKYLSKICRANSDRSASDWIREYAMLDIKCHLRNSSLSIKEVSARLGYSSLAFFGKTVRRWFGMTPTELRDHLRNNK